MVAALDRRTGYAWLRLVRPILGTVASLMLVALALYVWNQPTTAPVLDAPQVTQPFGAVQH
ncbi:hypothetical protein [Nocardia panacis]|uniref:hypothetical protein n=1 Tax=Nocardia panacis TaxID=2340916 RepID=UPI0011C435C1|nr:hypothetical protein [Nocardia panacis]